METNTADELKKIEELHKQDMEASKSGDIKTLRSLLTKDAVMMPPNRSWIRGNEQLNQNYREMQEAMSEIEITDYRLEFEEVTIMGEFAFEWGTIRGTIRNTEKETEQSSYKVMRILKRNDTGEWKVHRAIWNKNPDE